MTRRQAIGTIELATPVNPELLTRCAEYVRGWHGLELDAIRSGSVEQSPSVVDAYIALHNKLHTRTVVSDELLAAIGFRTIMQTEYPSLADMVREEVVSLVPRITRPASHYTPPQIQAQYERNALFTRRAK